MTAAPRPFDLMGAFGFGMSKFEAALRIFSMGGSDCNIIAKAENDPKKKPNMWDLNRMIEVKLGGEPDDLTQNINVMLGIWTEPLNIYLYECITGNTVFDRGITVDHKNPIYRASLDAKTFLPDREAILEAKWTSSTNLEALVREYYPQLQNNMDCTGLDAAVLSVIMRGKFDHIVVDRDDAYLEALRVRQEIVWEAVENGTGVLSAVLPPMPRPTMPAVFMRPDPVDLATLPQANMLGSAISVFCETYDAAKAHAAARKVIVENAPKDAKEMFWPGFLDGKRNAKGALTLVPANANQTDDDGDEE